MLISQILQIEKNKAHHGFLKGLSTATNILEAFCDWTVSVQAQKSVTVAYNLRKVIRYSLTSQTFTSSKDIWI